MSDDRVELQVHSGTLGQISPEPEKFYCEYWRKYVDRDHCKHFPDEGCAGGCPGPHREPGQP